MSTRVAIIIPTMNRPDFILRQLRFYELMNSPHPVYLSDSSNEDNASKLKDGLKEIKKFDVIYQWVPPGRDNLYLLLPLVKEKYCIQMGDDDIMIPETISECADFLESHPGYSTCSGKQVNIRFQKEDYNKPYGIIERQTQPLGRSLENDNMLARIKEFWLDLTLVNSKVSFNNIAFICFVVRSVELEKSIRNITKHFSLTEHIMEFLLVSILVISGKFKVLDKLMYVMQVSGNRYLFDYDGTTSNFLVSPDFYEKWKICEKEFSEFVQKQGKSEKESLKIVKWIFVLYLTRHFLQESEDWASLGLKIDQPQPNLAGKTIQSRQSLFKKARSFASRSKLLRRLYYKHHVSIDVTKPESKYYNDFKLVKDFLEKNANG